MYAKHIQIARNDGPEAGLDFYLSQRLAKGQPAFEAIAKKRTAKGKLDAYCKAFADDLNVVPRTPKAPKADLTNGGLIEALRALLTGETEEVEEVEDEPEDENPLIAQLRDAGFSDAIIASITDALPGVTEVTTSTPGKAKAKSTVKAKAGTLTAGDLWAALGSDDTMKPRDLTKPANNGQLYRANVEGLLSFTS